MANYLFIYRNSAEQQEKELSPDQMQKVLEAWNQWIGKGFEDGWMVSPGDALQLEGKVINEDKLVSDGPFAESKEIVGGYSVIQAADFSEACEIAKTCPAVETPTGTLEIRELAGFATSD